MNSTSVLKLRWEKAEEALQWAWDADNRRNTDASAARLQRAWDKAQRAKHDYELAWGAPLRVGAGDGWGPEETCE